MKTYNELVEIVAQNRQHITSLIRQAHDNSLQNKHSGQDCSIVAIGRQDGQIVNTTITADEQRDDLYILAAYPHLNPIEAVMLFADEKTAILNNWCLEQGVMAPEQGEEEGDVAYLARLVNWIKTNTAETAGEILIDLIRSQLLADFDAEAETRDALDELRDNAQGIVRLPPVDDEAADVPSETDPQALAVPPELIRLTTLDQDDESGRQTDQTGSRNARSQDR